MMGSNTHSAEQIALPLVLSVIIGCVVAQLVDSEPYTAIENSKYFFYQQPEYPRDCRDALSHCSASNSSGVYLIEPIGYMEPFEVFCVNEDVTNGWTVVLRRYDGSVSFSRNWTDFKTGFGFLSSDFWIGNDKLSHLTNQGRYELLIDMQLANGSSFFTSYNYFRISDEWGQYAVVSVGSHNGDEDQAVTYCPLNMIYGTCTCQLTCSNPNPTDSCNSSCEEPESCICVDGFLKKGNECVPPNECQCFVSEINTLIPNGESYVSHDCSLKISCQDDFLNRDSNYRCSSHAHCVVKDGVGQCQCTAGYEGDGETCSPLFKDCYEAYQAGHTDDGIYTILPTGWPGSPFNVSCVMSTHGGGWTVFQRRTNDGTDFYRNWENYRYGFGSANGDFWLGNEHLHYLTCQKTYKLRIDIFDSGGSSKYSEYSSFRVGNSDTNFRIDDIGSQSGTGGNGMSHTSGRTFSTYDQDNIECANFNCAEKHRGAWWFTGDWCNACWTCATCCNDFKYSDSCRAQCSYSNLNGDFSGGHAETVFWADGNGGTHCNLQSTEMKIRPI